MPKLRIEEAAANRQARIDRGEEVIVGVNKYRQKVETQVDILQIDNAKVRDAQISRIARTRRARDAAACEAALARLESVARAGDGNLLETAVNAARARATVGEISMALEKAWGRHEAATHVVSGVYGAHYGDDKVFQKLQADISAVAGLLGRRPRLLVVKMGQDGHDRGAKVIASAFGDLGFDVIAGPLFQTPEEAAELAMNEDADVVGISSHAAGHLTLAPMLLEELARRNGADKLVVCGGVIPAQDYAQLMKAGVAAIPLSAFYSADTNQKLVRFAFCKQRAVLEDAVGRLG
jgi:methylmalonyl-CoA mutase